MNTPWKIKIYFTAKDGSEAEIVGNTGAIEAIERAFVAAGIKFNCEVETWDEGYYETAPDDRDRYEYETGGKS